MNAQKIIRFPVARRKRDRNADLLAAAILEIRALKTEMAALRRMLPPAPFVDCEEN